MNNTNLSTAILTLALDRGTGIPLQVQLADQLRRLILAGQIPPGARLPSSRALAEDLSVSRVTVVAAIEQLVSEGYAEGRRGAGIFVASDLPEHVPQTRREETAPMARATPPEPLPPPAPARPFQVGAPDMTLFPHRQWSRLLEKVWRAPEPALLSRPDPCGWAPLRAAIAAHLSLWRNIDCTPQQVFMTSGLAESIELLAHSIFGRGESIMVEEPGFPAMRQSIRRSGLACLPGIVDDQGLDLLRSLDDHPDPRGVAVTPSRHHPLGMTLSLTRRLELLDWARRTGGLIIEDDYDSEYRYQGRPLPALMSLDDSERVIYLGSFSKIFSSALRLGFMVVPPTLIGVIADAMAATGPRASLIAQPALAQFMTDGGFAAHIRRTRRIYARRQTALVEALTLALGDRLNVAATPAGMHLVCEFLPKVSAALSDTDIMARAHRAGVTVHALSSYYAGRPLKSGLVMGYAGFDEAAIEAGVAGLKTAFQ